MEKLTIAQVKQIDLVEYLASLGHHPKKIRNQDYWYFSPFRKEKTPSFKIHRERKIWYDHGSGQGGDLIDFGTSYFRCPVKELLERLAAYRPPSLLFSFHPPLMPPAFTGEKKSEVGKIAITETRCLADETLLDYLKERNIPLEIAGHFCKEVDFLLYHKKYRAIGFQNNAGGYELRSADFKGSSSPKSFTFQDNGSSTLSVFEGFFNYLSYHAIFRTPSHRLPNFLVLNSAAFFQISREIMERHKQVNLYLDRDKTGISCTQEALNWDNVKYHDQSRMYPDHKDLNQWHMERNKNRKVSLKTGKGLKR